MQKVDRDWLAANDAHPHILHLADVLNSIVEHLTGDKHLPQGAAADVVHGIVEHLGGDTSGVPATTDGEVEATDPSGDD
ncbi:hypothetical protein QNM97_13810 [Gordonia sp. L191]|uniref:hypothetical protein n=1 Tax=Gordonia sp. L191 TaxID=2982699 RepID=UPI0024BFE0BA|nr:hypothetical protein [Gordonia sp. L191]WHU45127.1 hypothetical protein QNM97_13810 [Gordonia sp. L191]